MPTPRFWTARQRRFMLRSMIFAVWFPFLVAALNVWIDLVTSPKLMRAGDGFDRGVLIERLRQDQPELFTRMNAMVQQKCLKTGTSGCETVTITQKVFRHAGFDAMARFDAQREGRAPPSQAWLDKAWTIASSMPSNQDYQENWNQWDENTYCSLIARRLLSMDNVQDFGLLQGAVLYQNEKWYWRLPPYNGEPPTFERWAFLGKTTN